MTVAQAPSTLQRILDYSSRADPYPLYAELRRTPVARQEDGDYVVSTYREISTLLHDPHLSSDAHSLENPGPHSPSAETHRRSSASTRHGTTGCAAWRCGTSAPRTRPR